MTKRKNTDMQRCSWVSKDPLYIKYHDEEWGIPEYDGIKLFEMLCLEGQQAGLSWLTILKKREDYRKAFHNFDPHKIATMNGDDIYKLVLNGKVIKYEAKLKAIVNNARCYVDMQKTGEDFSHFIWSFVNGEPKVNTWKVGTEVPTQTPVSNKMSKSLKLRNFQYVGPTICHSFMQACGLVIEHDSQCYCYNREYKRRK